MENFCKDLNEHVMKLTDFETIKMRLYQKRKTSLINSRRLIIYSQINLIIIAKDYGKVPDHYHFTVKYTDDANLIFNLRYKNENKIQNSSFFLLFFHNGANHD